jgi:hypothetical protein
MYLLGGIFLLLIILLIWYFFFYGPKWIGKWGGKDGFIIINKNKTVENSQGLKGTYQIIDKNTFTISYDNSKPFKCIYDPEKETITVDDPYKPTVISRIK